MARHARGSAVCGAAVLAIVAAILPSAGPARAGASVVPQSAAARGRQAQVVTDQDWPAYLFSARHPSATAGPATIKLAMPGASRPRGRSTNSHPRGPSRRAASAPAPPWRTAWSSSAPRLVTSTPCRSRPVRSCGRPPWTTSKSGTTATARTRAGSQERPPWQLTPRRGT